MTYVHDSWSLVAVSSLVAALISIALGRVRARHVDATSRTAVAESPASRAR